MSNGDTKNLSVRFNLDTLFTSEDYNIFNEQHTRIRAIYVESDTGELTKIDVEVMEVDEVFDLTQE